MLHNLLNGYELVLASASPRRQEIFNMLGLNPLVVVSDVHEPIDHRPPYTLVCTHAKHKALSVASRFSSSAVIVAADTLVQVEGLVLGKPQTKEDAKRYLEMLSGKSHQVYTGVCILHKSMQLTKYAKSIVTFQKMIESEIHDYVETKEPADKAGAYGIQGYGCQFITGIRGCYFNVMGFPVNLFYSMIKELLQPPLNKEI